MQFQHPSFLWALGFLAIPIIIHLFNLRRYKTVLFSDIRFLKEVQQSTKKQRKLKEWLVLFARLLALSALIFAFAKPYFPIENAQKTSSNIILVIDNSSSTSVGLGEIKPLERAKQLAINLVAQLPENTQVALVTSATTSVNFMAKNMLATELENLTISDRQVNNELLKNQPNATVYVISDLQKNTFSFLNYVAANNSNWIVLPTITDDETAFNNVFIDSIWTETPLLIAGQPINLFLKLKSFGEQPTEVNLEILANGLPEITLAANLRADQDTIIKTSLTQLKAGFNTVQLQLENDEVAFDNRYFLSYFLPISNNIVEIYDAAPSRLISKIFTGSEFVFTSMPITRINNETLAKADLIILNELNEISSGLAANLRKNSENASLFIIPSAKNATALNTFIAEVGGRSYAKLDTAKLQTQTINTADPFFQEVFAGSLQNAYWPTISSHFKFGNTSRLPAFNLMTLANGDPIFIRIANKNNNIFQLALPLNDAFSDIAKHPIVVPMFIKALVKKDNLANLTGEIGSDSRFDISVPESSSETPVKLLANNQDFIPRQQKRGNITSILAGNDLQRSGNYKLMLEDKEIGNISFNISRLESDIQRYTADELTEIINQKELTNVSVIEANASTIKTMLTEWQQGIQLWKYCLLIALFFVLLEVILLRFLK